MASEDKYSEFDTCHYFPQMSIVTLNAPSFFSHFVVVSQKVLSLLRYHKEVLK